MRGGYTVSDFEKFKFYLPGEVRYGDDPEYEIFNPLGKVKYSLIDDRWLMHPDISKLLTLDGTPDIIYNLRRTQETMQVQGKKDRYIVDTLYAIIPEIREEICNLPEFGEVLKVDYAIVLAKDNSTIVEDPPEGPTFWGGCIRDANNKLYMFTKLQGRRKPIGDDTWQLY